LRHIQYTREKIRGRRPALAALLPLVVIALWNARPAAGWAARAGSSTPRVAALYAKTTGHRLKPVPQAASQARKAKTFRSVIDGAGRRVEVPRRVRRVVSLAPNVTDILYAVGAGSRVVGITNFTKLPQNSPKKPSVGDPLDPSIEKIVSLKPDLVFVSETINRLQTVESLGRLGIPVYSTNAQTVEGMLATIERVAALVGVKPAGEKLAERLQARLGALHERLKGHKPKRVLFVAWRNPLITTGRDTFLADALRWAGARNVVQVREHWPHVSLEEIVHLQPQELIFPGQGSGTAAEIRRALLHQPGWRELDAVRRGHLLVVSSAIDRPSPALVSVIERLAHELHPAAFADQKSPNAKAARGSGGTPRDKATRGLRSTQTGVSAPLAARKDGSGRRGGNEISAAGAKPWRP
jgi:iron complex transport system substrate-binding protein